MDNGDCPSTHPIRLISIFYEVLYHTEVYKDQWIDANDKPFRAMPFFWSTGDNTGYGHHGRDCIILLHKHINPPFPLLFQLTIMYR
jgi:hypothetical protein